MRQHLQDWKPASELQSLRKTLLTLAHDADLVLDLHCDCEAVVHFYTEEPCWPRLEPLARCLGAQAVLLASNSGGVSFDECLSGAVVATGGAPASGPRPSRARCPRAAAAPRSNCAVRPTSTTRWPRPMPTAIFAFLQHAGVVDGTPPALPPAACQATPLAGSQTLKAPVGRRAGVCARPGERLQTRRPGGRGHRPDQRHDPPRAGRGRRRAVCAHPRPLRPARRRAGQYRRRVPFRTGELLGA